MGCPKCGCDGLHACTGRPAQPWTEEDKAKLRSALEQVFKEENGDAEAAPSVPVAE